jgi:hypothetical protein
VTTLSQIEWARNINKILSETDRDFIDIQSLGSIRSQIPIGPRIFIVEDIAHLHIIHSILRSISFSFLKITTGVSLVPFSLMDKRTITLIEAKPVCFKKTWCFPFSFLVTCLGSYKNTAVSSNNTVWRCSIQGSVEIFCCRKYMYQNTTGVSCI